MHVEPVDPRSPNVEIYETATYEVRDWYNPAGDGPPTSESSNRITQASVWEVLEWAQHRRERGQLASFIWVMHNEDGEARARLLIGVLDWSSPEADSPTFHASMAEPDSEKGWAYFSRNFPDYGS